MSSLLTAGAVFAACSTKEEPVDCRSPDMAIVTFLDPGNAKGELRTCVDIHAASRPDATDASAGVDGSFATSRPGVYPWTNVTFEEASAACGRAGKLLCDYDVLAAITPTTLGGPGLVTFDQTVITAVPLTGPETAIAHRFDKLNPNDMLIRGDTGKPPFPEATQSVAFFTIPPEYASDSIDQRAAYLHGTVSGAKAIGGIATRSVVPAQGFRHPLVGFRCCILAKMRDAFPALALDPTRVLPAPDPDVPLGASNVGGAGGGGGASGAGGSNAGGAGGAGGGEPGPFTDTCPGFTRTDGDLPITCETGDVISVDFRTGLSGALLLVPNRREDGTCAARYFDELPEREILGVDVRIGEQIRVVTGYPDTPTVIATYVVDAAASVGGCRLKLP